MLAREFNLKGKENFEKVEKQGKVFQSELFGISFLKRKDNECSRFGFVISKKISGEAVHRNRIKRAMSEAVRFLLTEMKSGYDIVFLAKQESTRKSTDEIMKEVKNSISKAGFLKR